MTLLAVVNLTCDALEATAGDLRDLEQILVAPVDEEVREHLGTELAKVRQRIEAVTRDLHAERRADAAGPTRPVERRPCPPTRSRKTER